MNDAEYVLIKRRVHEQMGIDLKYYKSTQVRRRLDSYLLRTGETSWPAYLNSLSTDTHAARRLRDYLTINVTSFFRDAHKWNELRDSILPLLKPGGRTIHAWSSACSNGAELYSLAMLLQDQPGIGGYRVHGTDIDRAILEQARAGGPYLAESMKDVSSLQTRRYFQPEADGTYWVSRAALRGRVSFAELDLLRITARAEYDLVLCRNVLIYFTEEAKTRVIRGLTNSLKPGGILFIGSTENIGQGDQEGLERVAISFYRRAN
jgi:chemotaxis protein methyltransferase CheR